MQKCLRCNIVFQSADRVRCLYCDALLTRVSEGGEASSGPWLSRESPLIEQIIRNRRISGGAQFAYVLSNYFRIRSFHFAYAFSRHEYKMGREFKRWMVQPMSSVYLLILPWVVVNLLDSLLIRMTHNGYCEKCRWKYSPRHNIIGHDTKECEYNLEYSSIVKDIISGRILTNEDEYRTAGLARLNKGEKSAYFDLCARESYLSSFVDMAFVVFSVFLMIAFLVWIIFPWLVVLVRDLE